MYRPNLKIAFKTCKMTYIHAKGVYVSHFTNSKGRRPAEICEMAHIQYIACVYIHGAMHMMGMGLVYTNLCICGAMCTVGSKTIAMFGSFGLAAM